MVKVTMNIEGMHCGMCEAKVNKVVSESCKASDVVVSSAEGKCSFSAKKAPDEAALRAAIEDFGFEVKSYDCIEEKKKGFSLFKK